MPGRRRVPVAPSRPPSGSLAARSERTASRPVPCLLRKIFRNFMMRRRTMYADLERAFDLTGRTAVVTGAAGGIGRETSITLAQAGGDVVLADVAEAGLDETATAVRKLGRTATVVPTDVTVRKGPVWTRRPP